MRIPIVFVVFLVTAIAATAVGAYKLVWFGAGIAEDDITLQVLNYICCILILFFPLLPAVLVASIGVAWVTNRVYDGYEAAALYFQSRKRRSAPGHELLEIERQRCAAKFIFLMRTMEITFADTTAYTTLSGGTA